MAKKEKSIEEILWESAEKLRGSVESSEYKHVVLSLIFLKFVSDKFEEEKENLIKDNKGQYIDIPEFYTRKGIFYLPAESRWNYLIENAKQDDIAIKIDTALNNIEKSNKSLKGALPDNYYSRLGLDRKNLASLLDTIQNIQLNKDAEVDIIGKVYEYFLKKFAIAEGKGKGEFYTPKTVVKLISEMIEPYHGKVYDPCCGSGGMFVQADKFVESHNGNKNDISIYGQEFTRTTYKLAKMNLAIRGISADFGEKEACTFHNDQHKDLKADYIMANPPFNQKSWRKETELQDDGRWMGYDVPSTGNANYGWILHMISKLSENGTAGFLLSNGSLSQEYTIRKKMIDNDLVEAILILPRSLFYSTDISVCMWIINKNKKKRYDTFKNKNFRNRINEILFMDLRKIGQPFEKTFVEFTDDDIDKIRSTFHDWQSENDFNKYMDIPEFCRSVSKENVIKNDYSLIPSKYIEFKLNNTEIDYKEEIKILSSEYNELLSVSKALDEEIEKIFKEFNDEI